MRQENIYSTCEPEDFERAVYGNISYTIARVFAECEDLSEEQMQAIHIVTYQYCERTMQFPRVSNSQITLEPYDMLYCIFDEAHYFLSDALFNSNTNFWLDKLPTQSINVFLTATPEPLQWFLALNKANGNLFAYHDELCKILDHYKKQAGLRRELEENRLVSLQEVSILNGTLSTKTVTKYPIQYISDQCREIKIYSETLETIYHLVDKVKEQLKILPSIPCQYNDWKMAEFYFQEYCEIEERIKKSLIDEKWLVFVSNETEGIRLEARLNAIGTIAVFLSSKTVHKKGAGKTEFEGIIHNKKFLCKVLIATAVMDCGISILDPTVKHVVLSHCNKTAFLQMLGRKRMKDNEEISLYIRVHSERHIQGMRHYLETQMRTLIKFALRNDSDLIPTHTPSKHTDGMSRVSLLGKDEKNRVLEEVFEPQNFALTYTTAKQAVSKYTRYDMSKTLLLEEREYSKTAFAALLYELSNYIDALEDYRETKDLLFYLKRQLEWIGKKYNEAHWLNYEETKQAILDYLSAHCGSWLNKEAQEVFSIQCAELLLKFPVPPRNLKNRMARYNSSSEGPLKGPGLKILNASLEEKKLPYIIKSQQRYLSGKERKTFWQVKHL